MAMPSTAPLGELMTLSSNTIISSCLGPIKSHLTSQANESHPLLRIKNIFFQGMILPRQKDLIRKKYGFLSACLALKLSESLCLTPNRCLLPLFTASFFPNVAKNKKITVF